MFRFKKELKKQSIEKRKNNKNYNKKFNTYLLTAIKAPNINTKIPKITSKIFVVELQSPTSKATKTTKTPKTTSIQQWFLHLWFHLLKTIF